MRYLLLLFAVWVAAVPACTSPTPPTDIDAGALPRSAPEAQGVSSEGLRAFVEALDARRKGAADVEAHSLMVVRHGHVVAEGWWAPYTPDDPHMLYSLSKSFTATAVGLAVDEGLLALDDRVVSFFPDDLPETVDDRLAAMTIRDLLTMATGQENEGGTDPNWIRTFLAEPVAHDPGTRFRYNSHATFMLSAIVQAVTGQTVTAYLTPRLFEPLGIEGAVWDQNPQGIDIGGWGLYLTTEDIARFGLLYLQEGVWNGERLLPAAWVAEATARQIETLDAYVDPGEDASRNDWAQGYGYQFWQTTHDAVRGDGAFGQFALMLPEYDAVVALTSGSRSMQAELDLVWEYLLPAFHEAPLPPDDEAQAALTEKLASLTLLPDGGQATSPKAARVSGRTYAMEENAMGIEQATVAFEEEACRVTLRIEGVSDAVPCGIGAWVRSEPAFPGAPFGEGVFAPNSWRLAAAGQWTDADTFEVLWQFYETPFADTLRFGFDGEALDLTVARNVGGGLTRIEGRVASFSERNR